MKRCSGNREITCKNMSESAPALLRRKFFYLFTCEYCFSHYVAAIFLIITRFKLLYPDWRGYIISLFALVWLSNVYMALFANIRLDIHSERLEIRSKDLDVQSKSDQLRPDRAAGGSELSIWSWAMPQPNSSSYMDCPICGVAPVP